AASPGGNPGKGWFRVACPYVRVAALGMPVPRPGDDPPAMVQERPRPDRLRIERVGRGAGSLLERRDGRAQEDLRSSRRGDPGLREPRWRRGRVLAGRHGG